MYNTTTFEQVRLNLNCSFWEIPPMLVNKNRKEELGGERIKREILNRLAHNRSQKVPFGIESHFVCRMHWLVAKFSFKLNLSNCNYHFEYFSDEQ